MQLPIRRPVHYELDPTPGSYPDDARQVDESPYADEFAAVFPAIAKAHKITLGDYLLTEIATDLRYFQADQLHPTAEAQPILLDTVWRRLEPLLK